MPTRENRDPIRAKMRMTPLPETGGRAGPVDFLITEPASSVTRRHEGGGAERAGRSCPVRVGERPRGVCLTAGHGIAPRAR